jgi:amidase
MWTALHTPVINVPGFAGEVRFLCSLLTPISPSDPKIQNGMPVGLTLVSGRYKDRQLLKVRFSPFFPLGLQQTHRS